MTDYYTHNAGKPATWDVIDCDPVMVSEAVTAEDRAAFTWAWQQAARQARDEAYAALMMEGAQ